MDTEMKLPDGKISSSCWVFSWCSWLYHGWLITNCIGLTKRSKMMKNMITANAGHWNYDIITQTL